jgi:multidrug efflux pump
LFLALVLLNIKPPPVELFPSSDPLYVNAFIELPIGKSIEETNNIVKQIEDEIKESVGDRSRIVEAVLTQIGEDTSDPNSPPEPGFTPNKARITVQFVRSEERDGISTADIMNDMREALQGYAGVEVSVDQNANGPPVGKPINIEVRGEEIDSLISLTQNIKEYLNEINIAGIEELKSDVKIGKPELMININREAARRYELSTYSIASTIRTALFGLESSKLKVGEDEYAIMIRLNEEQRNDISTLINQKVTFRNPANGRIVQVPISAVADFSYSSTYNSIKRKDSERVITVFSNILDGYIANEVIAEIQSSLDDYPFPEGYTYEFTGEQQQQAEDMSFLMNAFLVALFAIFIIIVAQFNSIISPFIIVLSILFSTIGVFLGYFFSGDTVSIVFSGVGIISLAGVVVNNAIVLIDYVNLLIRRKAKEKGLDGIGDLTVEEVKACIVEGGSTRLRPVLLTAITTILGLIPLAIGFNMNFFTLISEFDPNIFIGGDNTAMWGPMAWTIIYGLTFATFLTLIVVPAMYWLAFRATRYFSTVRETKTVES